ncbi:hypothetical protein ACF0H5_010366 [Mactra antiquata]
MAECSNIPEEIDNEMCRCNNSDYGDETESTLPGMNESNPQYHPYCESSCSEDTSEQNTKQTSFKDVVKRHFVKPKLYSLVHDLLKSIDEEKQAQLDLLKSFEQAREVTAPIRRASVDNQKIPKRRRQHQGASLLDQIEGKRRDKERSIELSQHDLECVTESDAQSVCEIKLGYNRLRRREQREKEVIKDIDILLNSDSDVIDETIDADIANNNDKQIEKKQKSGSFKRRRSLSFLPGFLEKCCALKYFMKGNNIFEVDKLVLESMEENSYKPRDRPWRQKRSKKKKKSRKNDKIVQTNDKDCVIVEVESQSDSDRDEDQIAIINVAESPQSEKISYNENHDIDNKTDSDEEQIQVKVDTVPDMDKDMEEGRYTVPPNRKLTVNLAKLDTIDEASHESFSALNTSSEVNSGLIYNKHDDDIDEESDVSEEDTSLNSKSQEDRVKVKTGKYETARKSKKSSRENPPPKTNGYVANPKKSRPKSKEKRHRTLTLDILDVYEENKDLQRIDRDICHCRKNRRSKSAQPPSVSTATSKKKKPSKQKTQQTPIFDSYKTDENSDDDSMYVLETFKNSPRDTSMGGVHWDDDAETYFQSYKDSQRSKLYKKPDRVLWSDLDLTEGRYKMCNGSSIDESYNSQSRGRFGNSPKWNLPIREAIKNIRGTRIVPEIRQVNDTAPREERVDRLYKDLKKERSKSARAGYRMLKTPRAEDNGYYID